MVTACPDRHCLIEKKRKVEKRRYEKTRKQLRRRDELEIAKKGSSQS